MPIQAEKYKKLFLTEADEKIVALNKALLELEKKPTSVNVANDAMRAAHTLKSSAAAMNFMGISHLAHAMEDFFEQVRLKKHILQPSAIEVLFRSVDSLGKSLAAIKKGEMEISTKELVEYLRRVQAGDESGSAARVQGDTAIEPLEAIKVDVDTLDTLMNLTEELLVERMRLNEIVRRAKESPNQKVDLEQLESNSQSFNRLISETQFNVTQARMVPVGQIFERFPRMLRDLAHEQKKEVDFEIEGQEIELDRTVIDRLGEPLIHLLRNAVDHGIERKGEIILRAERQRDKVVIEVQNNGKPIDWPAVIAAAHKRGIIDSSARDKYVKNIEQWKKEIEALLYHPQLSTKEKVTETSGRGIGLSIVKGAIESLGGVVSLKSPIDGGGTRFTLQLPLTLAIIQALLVRVSSQIFALPFSQIDRSVRVSVKDIKKAFDQEVAVVEEEDIPLVRLDKIFGLERKSGVFLSNEELQETKRQLGAELLVITKKENLPSAGLVIDELLSEQDIVVKPFTGLLRQSRGFAGITLLGDGRPALILDVATLI